MQRIGTCFVIALLSVMFCAGPALGVTVLVNVFEKEGNITPLAGAILYANGALVGKSDSSGNIEFSHPGTELVQVTVEKTGYESWTGDIGVNTTTLLVEMAKKRVPLLVQVYDTDTLSPVPGATVSIRDGLIGNANQTGPDGTTSFIVTGGSVCALDIAATNYRTFSEQVEVGLEPKTVQVMLFRDDRFTVLVKDEGTGTPLPGASVFVDGVDRGVTDPKGAVTLALPREKVYSFQVHLEGYDDYRDRQIVEKDQAFVTVPLHKSPYSVFVSVYSEERAPVEGAVVLVEGRSVGVTNRYGRVQLTNLTFGEYQIEVRHPSFIPHTQVLPVHSQGEDVSIDLQYPGLNATITTVEGGAVPVPGVSILLNGKEQGVTGGDGTLSLPLRLNTPYVISAKKEGYSPISINRTFSSQNETGNLVIPMEKGIDWLIVGVVVAAAAIACIAAVIILGKRRPKIVRGRRGGL